MSNKRQRCFIDFLMLALIGASGVCPGAEPAGGYKGAEAVLSQASEPGAKPKAPVEKVSPAAALRADLKVFQKSAGTLGAAEAAKQWLALFDRFVGLEQSPSDSMRRGRANGPVQVQELFEALPPPAAWGELARAIEARPAAEKGAAALRAAGLKLAAHTLTGETSKRKEDLSALETMAAKAKRDEAYLFNSVFEELSRAFIQSLENPELVLQVLERKLAAGESESRYESSLEVPDLVTLVGPEKAEAFLRKALVKSSAELHPEEGTATEKLARKLALELVDSLKKPQWHLVNSLDSTALYEALEKRFSKPATNEVPAAIPGLPTMPVAMEGQDDYERQNARIYYFLGLIAQGRATNAVAVARKFDRNVYFPSEVIRDMERAGFAKELNSFFHEILQQDPELPFWGEYVQLAAHAGETAEMVELVRSTAGKAGVSKNQRARLQQLLYKALLANDEVEAGAAELQRLIASPAGQKRGGRNYSAESAVALSVRLAQVGRLLGRTNWIEEGLAGARKALETAAEEESGSWGYGETSPVARLLEKLNRGPEAEAVLAQDLARAVQRAKKAGVSRYGGYGYGSEGMAASSLAGLVRLYHQAGRYDDVLRVFDQAAWWGAADLAQLNRGRYLTGEYDWRVGTKMATAPLGYYAAAALLKTGREDAGRKILDQMLEQAPGCDRLYELLLSVEGDQAPARLDGIFARDQFEERPLIWKAHWLRTHQRLEEAEQAARKAIAIDPTDGEEPPGDRLRAYAELAEIRAARGDQKEARLLHSAVEAVQQAERADEFQEAGLLKRAVAMYEESLYKFADAYCIHARLAVQLSDLGRHQEAEEHYRRAYELMPDSFGRVESHCFGCERAFDGERAQGIAERVFTKLARETPEKPQVHYMLGYLREEENRLQEALASYRIAVKLDPDYLNAWCKMEGLGRRTAMPGAERDTVVFNILRLDPYQRRDSVSLELVSDLATLWKTVEAANARRPVPPESLYPLPASKAEMDKGKNQGGDRDFDMAPMIEEYSNRGLTPAKAVTQNAFLKAAQQLVGRETGDSGE